MFRQLNSSSCVAISVCALIILSGYRYLNDIGSCPIPETNKILQDYPKTGPQTYVEILLEMTRMAVKVEMWNYNFSYSGVDKLEDLAIESGGTPARSIIVSTWRSGSSFLGDLINAVPGTFYSYEPLMMFGIKQIRTPPLADKAISFLKNLLKCDYNNKTDFEKYFTYAKKRSKWLKQFIHNERLWNKCNHKQELCYDADFTAKFCKLFPFQAVKLDRMRLPPIKSIMDDEQLNVKVVLLVRDPRGVMHSRKNIKNFCSPKNIPDCADPSLVCSDMVTDYKAAADFLHRYPDRLMVMRYEDLAFNLEEMTLNLLKFLRLEPTPSIHKFRQKHTTTTNQQPYSTFRVTKNIPFKWKKALKFNAVNEIQEKCKEAMSLWGYELVHNESHMASEKFNPLSPYYIKWND